MRNIRYNYKEEEKEKYCKNKEHTVQLQRRKKKEKYCKN